MRNKEAKLEELRLRLESVTHWFEKYRILKDELINIHSIFAWPDKKFTGVYHLVMRVSASDGPRAVNVLKSAGYNVLTGYVKDLTPYLPKI